jgi:hypothetical protein
VDDERTQNRMAEKEEEELGDDLYADIELPSSLPNDSRLAVAAPDSGLPDPAAGFNRKRHLDHPKSLTDQVIDLQQTVKRLQTENETLKRNMGTLFRTATAELARKDRQPQQVQRQQLALADQS